MYIKHQKNPKNGHIYVKVFERQGNKEVLVKYIGTASCAEDLKDLEVVARSLINRITSERNYTLFKDRKPGIISVENLEHVNVYTVGLHDIFGKVFDEIGLNKLNSELLRDIVIARIGFPQSKFKTVDYLREYCDINLEVTSIYRFMDKLNDSQKEKVCDIAYRYCNKILDNGISVLFFDATTLHFETFEEDDLRRMGYSKVGKFNQPQILIALLVTSSGLPVGYEVFSGNVFEGHTLIPVLEGLRDKYDIRRVVFVADNAMLSRKNLELLDESGFEFVIGAKVKGETDKIKYLILSHVHPGSPVDEFKKGDRRLIVSYSPSRAANDARNRERAIKRMKKRIALKNVGPSMIGNQGARKFLKLMGKSRVSLDFDKIKEDGRWDGLKGYLTNSRDLSCDEVISQYSNLWEVEKAFRMSKTDLLIRPIYHYKEGRIHAHICISFAALLVGKVAEFKLRDLGLSLKRIVEQLKLVRLVIMNDSKSGYEYRVLSDINQDQRDIYKKLEVTRVAENRRIG